MTSQEGQHTKQKILIVTGFLLAFLLGASLTYAVMTVTRRIESTAQVKAVGVGIYAYDNKTGILTQINWGVLEPGQSKNFTCYVFNEGNTPITLTMSTENWTPTNAQTYVSLTWNYKGSQITPSDYVAVTFTLSVSANVQGLDTFSFTIVVTGTG